MATSKFTIYSSLDAGAPVLSGSVGTLLTVLDAVLVNGYGTKAGAGWTKPFSNSGNIGCYQNSASGTNMCLVVNDNGPGVATYQEARLFGFESLTTVSTGNGPFPNAVLVQGANSGGGFMVARKSAALSGLARTWTVVADQYTVYMFVLTGDGAGNYMAWGFGDIYSIKGTSDLWRCFISGRQADNSGSTNFDCLPNLNGLTTINVYNFMARTYGGGGFSINIDKHGDGIKGGAGLLGNLPYPNPVDNAIYVSPVWISETAYGGLRGRMRGFFQILHPIATFTDGQTFSGGGDYAGKTFLVIKQGVDNSGNTIMYVIETSNTVETN